MVNYHVKITIRNFQPIFIELSIETINRHTTVHFIVSHGNIPHTKHTLSLWYIYRYTTIAMTTTSNPMKKIYVLWQFCCLDSCSSHWSNFFSILDWRFCSWDNCCSHLSNFSSVSRNFALFSLTSPLRSFESLRCTTTTSTSCSSSGLYELLRCNSTFPCSRTWILDLKSQIMRFFSSIIAF